MVVRISIALRQKLTAYDRVTVVLVEVEPSIGASVSVLHGNSPSTGVILTPI